MYSQFFWNRTNIDTGACVGVHVRVPHLHATRHAALVAWIALSWIGLAAAAEPDIRIDRNNAAFRIDASLVVKAHHHIAWQVLTDYDNLAAFVPGMRTSKIVSAPGEPLLLKQTGQTGFLGFTFPVEFVARIEEIPLDAIRFEAVSGNLERKSGAWQIERLDDMTRVNYRAEIVPGFWVPGVIGAAVIGQDVRNKLVALDAEMRRRQASDPSAQPVSGRPAAGINMRSNIRSACYVRL